jgi:hypothetical protein
MPTSKDTSPADQAAPAPDAPGSEFLREQQKGGRDPVNPPVEPSKSEPVDIAPGEPYPTGGGTAAPGVPQNAPAPEEGK